MPENSFLKTLQKFQMESGIDEQFDLQAVQAVGIADQEKRILRVWYNDGRIRDWDCHDWIVSGNERIGKLAEARFFTHAATVWNGAPGFDLGGLHDEADCIDFDPYEIWCASKDVTEEVLAQENESRIPETAGLCVAESGESYQTP